MVNVSIIGTDAKGRQWEYCTNLCDYDQLLDGDLFAYLPEVARELFIWLTNGQATYGKPGQGGCQGPYTIRQVTLRMEPLQ